MPDERWLTAAWSDGDATRLAGAAPGNPAGRGGGESLISVVRHCLSIDG